MQEFEFIKKLTVERIISLNAEISYSDVFNKSLSQLEEGTNFSITNDYSKSVVTYGTNNDLAIWNVYAYDKDTPVNTLLAALNFYNKPSFKRKTSIARSNSQDVFVYEKKIVFNYSEISSLAKTLYNNLKELYDYYQSLAKKTQSLVSRNQTISEDIKRRYSVLKKMMSDGESKNAELHRILQNIYKSEQAGIIPKECLETFCDNFVGGHYSYIKKGYSAENIENFLRKTNRVLFEEVIIRKNLSNYQLDEPVENLEGLREITVFSDTINCEHLSKKKSTGRFEAEPDKVTQSDLESLYKQLMNKDESERTYTELTVAVTKYLENEMLERIPDEIRSIFISLSGSDVSKFEHFKYYTMARKLKKKMC